jgi:hypothetical protein
VEDGHGGIGKAWHVGCNDRESKAMSQSCAMRWLRFSHHVTCSELPGFLPAVSTH